MEDLHGNTHNKDQMCRFFPFLPAENESINLIGILCLFLFSKKDTFFYA